MAEFEPPEGEKIAVFDTDHVPAARVEPSVPPGIAAVSLKSTIRLQKVS